MHPSLVKIKETEPLRMITEYIHCITPQALLQPLLTRIRVLPLPLRFTMERQALTRPMTMVHSFPTLQSLAKTRQQMSQHRHQSQALHLLQSQALLRHQNQAQPQHQSQVLPRHRNQVQLRLRKNRQNSRLEPMAELIQALPQWVPQIILIH